MAGFAVTDLEALDFDFTSAPRVDGQPGNCTAKGTVPEPSDAKISAFLKGIQELGGIEGLDDAGVTVVEEVRKLVAALCSGTPSEEELAQLPFRVMTAFLRWLLRELLVPKE